MIQNVLESIEGVAAYPVISLVVFVLFFIVVIFRLVKMDSNYINKMKNLPLNDKDNKTNNFSGDLNEK